ncbi:MAG: hypothetical protein ACIAXF_00835 [Phycisphaerales bacterium JB063]
MRGKSIIVVAVPPLAGLVCYAAVCLSASTKDDSTLAATPPKTDDFPLVAAPEHDLSPYITMTVHQTDGTEHRCGLRGSDPDEERTQKIYQTVSAATPTHLPSDSSIDTFGVVHIYCEFHPTVRNYDQQSEANHSEQIAITSSANSLVKVHVNQNGPDAAQPYSVMITQDSAPIYTLHFDDVSQSSINMARAIKFALELNDSVSLSLLDRGEVE